MGNDGYSAFRARGVERRFTCFVAKSEHERRRGRLGPQDDVIRGPESEEEPEATRTELPFAYSSFDVLSGEQKAIKRQETLEWRRMLQTLLPVATAHHLVDANYAEIARNFDLPIVFIVDGDSHVREGIRATLEKEGRVIEDFADCGAFLEAYRPGREGCLLIDACLPGINGIELLERLRSVGYRLPTIMIASNGNVSMVVRAMKAGASDFLEKPVGCGELLASVEHALVQSRDIISLAAWRKDACNRVATLTPRQRQIMELVVAGHPSKNIAADLCISQRTVESHRASIMEKTCSKSLPGLARLALLAEWSIAE